MSTTNPNPELEYRTKQVFYGGLLGDSYLIIPNKKYASANDMYAVKHGPKQRKYLLWKLKELSPLGMKLKDYKCRGNTASDRQV